MNLRQQLDRDVTDALQAEGAVDAPAVVKPASKPEFGHYQANGVMGAAKRLKTNPRQLAERIAARLDADANIICRAEVAGPGFINLHLDADFLAARMAALLADDRLGIPAQAAETIVIDYSSPNLAKEMHIGHIRTTTIGDCLARILEFLGHNIIRANHVGDWGAQFGSLLAHMDTLADTTTDTDKNDALDAGLQDLEDFYRQASHLFKEDAAFTARAREYVVRLQQGDPHCLQLWRHFIDVSVSHCQAVYDRLNITLTKNDIAGESMYNADLQTVVKELQDADLITVSDGARCVFLPQFSGKDGRPLPAIVQKSDGGFPYMATDIAALRHRTRNLGADRALYVIDARQTLHMQQLFAIGHAVGYLQQDRHDFRHLPFGTITNEDRIPFKTRSGGTVKLAAVIEEAEARADDLIGKKNPQLTAAQRREAARAIGIGALKYAELSKNRVSDYVFNWDTMLSFEGNTAPYLLYAYTRIRSIFRRDDIDPRQLDHQLDLADPAEQRLAVKLLQFPEAIDAMLEDYLPNLLCSYLYELAGEFMSFYEACPVLRAEPAQRNTRLALCLLTGRILQRGLDLLGIDTVEQM